MRFFKILYAFVVSIRNWLFESGFLKAEKFDPVIISVGNLLAGGTGKTPIADFLIHLFKKKNLKVGLISRGYKGHFKGIRQVDIQNLEKIAYVFGDEPSMLALKHKEIPIFVGKNKRKALKALLKEHLVDLVIADDAFQHRWVHRDFDLVVIDALAEPCDYQLLPQGKAREPLSSLKRAHVVFLNRVNLISDEKKEKLISEIKKYFFSEFGEVKKKLPIVETKCFIDSVRRLSDGRKIDQWEEKKILLASGIGRPSSFFKLIKEKNHFILGHKVFKDHHLYSLKDLENLLYEKKKLKADLIVITEKDAVKFLSFLEYAPFFCVAQMSLEMDHQILKFEKKVLERVKNKNLKL